MNPEKNSTRVCQNIFNRDHGVLVGEAIVGYFTYKTIVQPTIFLVLRRGWCTWSTRPCLKFSGRGLGGRLKIFRQGQL